MDSFAIRQLQDLGVDTNLRDDIPAIPIGVDNKKHPVVLADLVPVAGPGDKVVSIRLKNISALFTGDKVPPSFADGPTDEYVEFFMLIEQTAANYCVTTKRIERDTEFESLYNHLRRRPEGRHSNPLFSYLQAAVRLYMSLHDTSQAEFEAVVDRLRRSAKKFAMGATTANYYHVIRNQFGMDDGSETPWPLSEMI